MRASEVRARANKRQIERCFFAQRRLKFVFNFPSFTLRSTSDAGWSPDNGCSRRRESGVMHPHDSNHELADLNDEHHNHDEQRQCQDKT